MELWFTTAELAALKLPGLPTSKKGWALHVKRYGWLSVAGKHRQRRGHGGGVEYHSDLLPDGALATYGEMATGTVVVDNDDRLEAERQESETVALAALDHRDARLALLAASGRFAEGVKVTRATADGMFCGLYNIGKIPVDGWVREAVKELAPRSLNRWRALRASGQIGKLAIDKGAARRGSGTLDQPEVRAWLLGFIACEPQASAEAALRYLKQKHPDIQTSHRSVMRALKTLKDTEKVALTRITNPDAWKSKYEPSGQNSNAASRLNELWLIDASPADVMLTTGRHSIYACIDRYSRRTIIYVTKTPRSEAVCLLLRRALLAWGVPEIVKTDNGSDFKAKRTVGLLNFLEIDVRVSAPFDPKAKAHVERVIKTFQHDCASELSGFIGHSVADRKVIEERKSFAQRIGQTDDEVFHVSLDAKTFQEKCDHWAAMRYEHREHGGLKKKTPWQVASSYQGKIRRIEDVHALDMLLAPIAGSNGIRTTSKLGVRIDNAIYMTPTVLPATRVFVRMDPADMGRCFLFTEDGLNFLGEGMCPELAGVDPAKAAAETKRQLNDLLAEGLKPIRASQRQFKKDKSTLSDLIARGEAEAAGKLVSLPRPSETYSTPALEAAREAIGPALRPEDVRAGMQAIDARVDGYRAEVEGNLAGAQAAPGEGVQPLRKEATPQQRMARARDIAERMRCGVEVSNAEAVWLGGFQRHPEYIGALANADERFRHVLFLDAAKKSGAPLWSFEEAWLTGYRGGAEYAARLDVYTNFGEVALR